MCGDIGIFGYRFERRKDAESFTDLRIYGQQHLNWLDSQFVGHTDQKWFRISLKTV